MKLFKLFNTLHEKRPYRDEYVECVVCAESEEAARQMHPLREEYKWNPKAECWMDQDYPLEEEWQSCAVEWVEHIKYVEVEYIGECDVEKYFNKVVMASYHGH